MHMLPWQALQVVVSVSLPLQPSTGHLTFLLTVVSLPGLQSCISAQDLRILQVLRSAETHKRRA